MLPRCDRCGRFTADGVEVESPRPDFWNGPAVDLYCPRCLADVEGGEQA